MLTSEYSCRFLAREEAAGFTMVFSLYEIFGNFKSIITILYKQQHHTADYFAYVTYHESKFETKYKKCSDVIFVKKSSFGNEF